MVSLESLTLAQQQYIETIADLVKQTGEARTSRLARKLEVKLPSVTEAVNRLTDMGLAARKSWHEIVLTAAGEAVWRQLDRRHRVLRRFMVDVLAMDNGEADANACRIEHCIDPAFVERLTSFADFFQRKPEADARVRWDREIRRRHKARPRLPKGGLAATG